MANAAARSPAAARIIARMPASSDSRRPSVPSRQLDHLRAVWERLGEDDPLWAVLSDPGKRGGRWQPGEFFATGEAEIAMQLAVAASHGLPRGHDLALDFGCGAGRLTRALAGGFRRVIGVDVSASMVATAQRLNADLGNVEFRVNAAPDLASVATASVDFLCSHITLQHMPAELAEGYVAEFFRVLAPGGVAVFQFVTGSDASLRGRLYGAASNRWLNPLRRIAWRRRDVFEMHALDERQVRERLATMPSLQLVAADDEGSAGAGWHGRRWMVANTAPPPRRVELDGIVYYFDAGDVAIGGPIGAGAPHDPHVAGLLRERLRPGDVMLDIGANIGGIALQAARCVGPRGRVIAVEPLPRNCELLARAAQANDLGHLEIIRAAAARQEGTLELLTHPSTSNTATPAAAGERLRGEGGQVLRARAVVLDEVLDLPRLDAVKIDVEGMEPHALRGLERHLRRHRPLLVSEFHPLAMHVASGVEPLAYLQWLLDIYPAITVLHRDGRRERCADAATVMATWERANAAAGLPGTLHLDIALGMS